MVRFLHNTESPTDILSAAEDVGLVWPLAEGQAGGQEMASADLNPPREPFAIMGSSSPSENHLDEIERLVLLCLEFPDADQLPVVDLLCRRHPELASSLRTRFALVRVIRSAARRSRTQAERENHEP